MNAANGLKKKQLALFEKIFRDRGLSITPQRVAIYKELIASADHPSAVAIFSKVRAYYKNISLDTVNRTLLTFREIGLAKVVESSGDPKRFDPNIEPHHHFRCVRCGTIADFKNTSFGDIEVPSKIKEKYVILDKRVYLEGFCDKCRAKG